MWDLNNGECFRTFNCGEDEVEYIAWSCDGQYLISSNLEQIIMIWNVNTGECLQTLEREFIFSRFDCISSEDEYPFFDFVEFSPNGKLIVAPLRYGTLKIWGIE